MNEDKIFSLVGEEGFTRLVAAFIGRFTLTTFLARCIRKMIAQEPSNDFAIS